MNVRVLQFWAITTDNDNFLVAEISKLINSSLQILSKRILPLKVDSDIGSG